MRGRGAFIIRAAVLYVIYGNTLMAAEEGPFIYDSKGRRDPFIPLITQHARAVTALEDAETLEDIRLEGILWENGGNSIAIVNGILVKEKQAVGNVYIKEIRKNSITILINEVEYNIDLMKKGE